MRRIFLRFLILGLPLGIALVLTVLWKPPATTLGAYIVAAIFVLFCALVAWGYASVTADLHD